METGTNTAHTALSALAAILHGSSVIPPVEGCIPDASVKAISASTLTVETTEHEQSSQDPDGLPPTCRSPTCESIHGNDDSVMDSRESVLDHQAVKPPEPQPADDSVFGSTDGLQAISRRPVAAHPGTDIHHSTASYAPGDNSLWVSDTSKPHHLPSPPSSEGDSAIVMEAVTDPLASLEVTPTEEVSAVEAAEAANAVLDERVFALLTVELRHKSAVRDPPPFLAEMYKCLTKTQETEGIVYVLAHTEDPALFKIGYTGSSAEKRLAQSNGCYKANTQIIHETHGGPFFAARKAEKLARLALRHENLVVTACPECGKRHMEWFRTPRETVIETVESMERLVQLPAYERVDGNVWRLSQAVHDAMNHVAVASVVENVSGGHRRATEVSESGSPMSARKNSMEYMTSQCADMSLGAQKTDIYGGTEGDVMPSLEAGDNHVPESPTPKKRWPKRLAAQVHKAKTVTKAIRKSGSRHSTPEVDGGRPWSWSPRRDRDSAGSPSDDVKDAIMGVFLSLLSEKDKDQYSKRNKEDGLAFVQFVGICKQNVWGIFTDMKDEWREQNRAAEALKSKGR
ncbi:predicted protein [Verticillium alfalfae VaMs.102]|uniref:Predicted protein n=1 Tax=Verticillium alfalfae (strain VaMs.102 / ATCC MYA-4576 / FGSC 10136) TaxID=526221 RepID=C9ST97_VERA1|nr:predicted protein [Verticillium alfalfae VaMs.102]EEY22012.1 predicted protein [Verticillium alfalfae VaMs.102]